ncbi:MAG: tetratricopeptide repeat protein [Treponema sp.]|nr:tetratricopeptide repeat protein [Treponema sp.]MDE7382974.1 tetratricopeptide repeat protein [Treponemataceae bacterium]MBD5406720.1 tetratricopeptide repeat protein [Treponema sp.]MBD5408847.1 tetratricopeptide repeat protein [Treponema sp.]MBD5410695.1 tetratricopeptide repeat protein [Treponema sp.]
MTENAEKLNNQAIKLAHNGSVNEAILCFKRAITLNSENHLFWFNLGVTFRNAGNLREAEHALEQSYHLNPYDTDVIETLAIIYFELGKLETAIECCYNGLTFFPENPHLWNTIGAIHFNQEKYTDAAEAFEIAITINPYYYDALFNLRDTYIELGNKNGAIEIERKMKNLEKR